MALDTDAIIGDAIFNLLSTDASVAAIVGTKIFPAIAPQGTDVPFIVYEERLSDPLITKEGPVQRDYVTLEIVAIDKTYRNAIILGNKIRQRLNGYKGTVAGVNIAGIHFSTVLSTYFNDQTEYYENANRYKVRVN